jgi:hypothetical protein
LGGPGTLFQKGSWPPEAQIDGGFRSRSPLYLEFLIAYNLTMNVFDEFDRIVGSFSQVEEPQLLSDIREFAAKHRGVVIKTYTTLLEDPDLDSQLKSLVLKSIADLKYDELVPPVKDTLYMYTETNLQLIYEAVDSLTAIGSFPAYKAVVDFLVKNREAGFARKVEQNLGEMFTRNPLVYHFDVFYRDREPLTTLEKSSKFLILHLPHEYIRELLPALNSRHYKIRFELLRILKERPSSFFYANIYYYFKENYRGADEGLFLMLSEALIVNASVSKARSKIFQKLKEFMPQLEGEKKKIFGILLQKLNNRELIPYIASIYPQLNSDRKMLALNNLDPNEYTCYREFIRELLISENNETLLAKIVETLVRANELKYLFAVLEGEKGLRKAKLLGMILELEPRGVEGFIKTYITPSQDNRILHLSIEYLLHHAPDTYFDIIKRIFFSGVSTEIKILIIQNVQKWSAPNQRAFMKAVFKNLNITAGFKRAFLFSLLGVLNEKLFDKAVEEKILSQLLVLMEESPGDELGDFIYFFDRCPIASIKDKNLIIAELRLIRDTLLKSSDVQTLERVRMIRGLIKNIEKKTGLEKE